MDSEVKCENIGVSTLGNELTLTECSVLASVMHCKHFQDGEMLVPESDAASTLYLLVDGQIEVIGQNEGQAETLYTMTPGEVAGTRAFVDRSPRKASLRAKGSVTAYTMEPDDFESLLDEHPRIVYKVMRGLFRITHANLLRMNQETAQLSNYINKSGGRY